MSFQRRKGDAVLSGPALAEARTARGLSQEEAAGQIGVSARTLWRWEHGAQPNRLGKQALRLWLGRPQRA